MLKNDFIRIKTKGCRKLDYFKSLGYDIDKEFIDLKLKDLNVGSREKLEVICDFCNSEILTTWKEYLRNTNIGNKYACSKKCGSKKAKETNLEKYGIEHPLKLEKFKEKQKKTNIEKYGVEYLQQSKLFKDKSKETSIKNHGVEHYSKLKSSRDRASMWLLSNEFREKAKETLLKNYQVDNPSKSEKIRETIEKNNIIKYGVNYPSKLDTIKAKNKNTLYLKFDSDNITKSEVFRKDNFIIAKNQNYIKYLNNSISLFKCDCGEDHYFEIKSDNYYKRVENKIPLCTVCYPINELKSIKEMEFSNFIKSIYNKNVILNYRDILEIDIYLPDIKLGFEFNGLYWHSEEFKDKNYHSNKTKYFNEKGIRIIHIWEDDWTYRQNIIKSQIKNLIGLTENKIFARKCIIKEINNCKDFLNSNHIQGNVNSVIKIGLYFEDELVSLMTFDKFEGRKKMPENEWNLSRFCNKIDTTVIGAASKLLNYFIKKYNPSRIISYADNSWSQGNLYYQLGFTLSNKLNPDYKYIVENKKIHKSNFKMKNERQKMIKNNINKIWDCGKLKFTLNLY